MDDTYGRKVYIGGLADDTREGDLRDFFRDIGPISEVWVATNPPGYGFVTFRDRRDADDAVADLDGKMLVGRRVRVEIATGRPKSSRTSRGYGGGGGGGGSRGGSEPGKIFLGNLSDRTEKRDVEDFLRGAGRINSVWLARSPPGFGFVVFDDPRDASDAVIDFDGRELLGRRVTVEPCRRQSPGRGGRGGRDRRSRSPRGRQRSYYDDRRERSRDRNRY